MADISSHRSQHCPYLVRAIIKDLYDRVMAAQLLCVFMMIMAIAPIFGPLLGGWIIKISTWQMIFWLLVAFGIFIFIMLLKIPETLKFKDQNSNSVFVLFKNYFCLLRNFNFMRYNLTLCFYYAAIYSFIVASPFVYTKHYGVLEQNYGYLFGVNILGVVLVSLLNKFLLKRFRVESILRFGVFIATFGASWLFILLMLGFDTLFIVVFFVFITFCANGIIAACATAVALENVGKIADSASALIGSFQYGSGVLSSIVYVYIQNDSPMNMAFMIFIFTSFSFLWYF